MAGSCEHCNVISSIIKFGKCLDGLNKLVTYLPIFQTMCFTDKTYRRIKVSVSSGFHHASYLEITYKNYKSSSTRKKKDILYHTLWKYISYSHTHSDLDNFFPRLQISFLASVFLRSFSDGISAGLMTTALINERQSRPVPTQHSSGLYR
jgi:hypothetical protein